MNGSRVDKLRRGMQFGFLAVIVTVALYPHIFRGMHRFSILFLWLIIVANLLFGKLFCSHLCPGGLLSEYISKLRNRFIPQKWGIRRWSLPDNLLRSLKYIFAIVMFHPTLNAMVPSVLANTVVIVSIVIFGLFENMFFCKYICIFNAASNVVRFTIFVMVAFAADLILDDFGIKFPIMEITFAGGYLLEIFFKKAEYNISLLHIHRDVNKCRECGKCNTSCPYSVEVSKVKRVVDIDCNLCGDCVKACENDALKVGICNTRPGQNRIRGVWFAPLITMILLAIAIYMVLRRGLFYIQFVN